MKAWALIAVAAAEAARSGLRGSEQIKVVHHRHVHHDHVVLLAEGHKHAAARNVDFGSFADPQTEANQDAGQQTGIISGQSYAEEAGVAAQSHAAEPEAPPAPAAAGDDAASVVFGESGEAPTREEMAVVHKRAKAEVEHKPVPPYHVTLDIGAPPPLPALPAVAPAPVAPVASNLAAINSQVQKAEVTQQQQNLGLAAQQQAAQKFAAQERQAQLDLQAARQAQTAAAGTAMTTAMTSNTISEKAVAAPQGITRPKGWDQCLKFSRFTKAQGVTGMELIKTWKATCEPAVSSGVATERYKVMCNALGGTVEPFAAQQDYDVEKLCDAVLAVFHDVTAVDVKAASFF
jgi:hypothetical protein